MDNVIKLADFRFPWHEAFKTDGSNSTLQVYANDRTGHLEFVQMNDDGEAIRTELDEVDTEILRAVLENRKKRSK